MRTNKPVIVFVGDDNRATEFMETSGTYVLGAPTSRIALAQTVFSFPDAIIIDATPENMQLAEDVYFHLRTIKHPAIVLLSDVPALWDTQAVSNVTILPTSTSHEEVAKHMRLTLSGALEPAC
jgi:hypothetical protein